jgi:Flp pilus assembly protein TadG
VLRRFRRDERGATAVEFGIVALPFFALMMAIFETFLLFFASSAIEAATERASRLIRTGQAQEGAMDAEAFRTEICEAMVLVINCMDRLVIDVRTHNSFATVDLAAPINEDGEFVQDFGYDPGVGGDIIVVRAFYEWPIHTNFLGLGLANLANGSHLIAGATAFRNEPF